MFIPSPANYYPFASGTLFPRTPSGYGLCEPAARASIRTAPASARSLGVARRRLLQEDLVDIVAVGRSALVTRTCGFLHLRVDDRRGTAVTRGDGSWAVHIGRSTKARSFYSPLIAMAKTTARRPRAILQFYYPKCIVLYTPDYLIPFPSVSKDHIHIWHGTGISLPLPRPWQ